MKKHMPTILVVLLLIFGLTLLFYPDFSTWYNSRIQAGIVDDYTRYVAEMPREHIYEQFRRAEEHNADLARLEPGFPFVVGHMALGLLPEDYTEILNVRGTMGQIQIPKLNINLPIFHTTHESVLHRGAGHLEGTAFPIGGYSTHSVITAHSGLPNARMFTDMLNDNIGVGDQFFVEVLDRRLAYEVFYVQTVLPHEIESLRVVPGEDLMTLITCTPYAVNSHRLLVHGRRIPYVPYMAEEIEVEIAQTRVDVRVFIFIGFFILFMLVFFVYQIIVGKREYVRPGMRVAPVAGQGYIAPIPVSNMHTDPYINLNEYDWPQRDTIRTEKNAGFLGLGIFEKSNSQATGQDPPREAPGPRYNSRNKTTHMSSQRRASTANVKRNIAAACIAALVLIMGIGMIAQMRSPSSPNAQTAVADFVARIEDYRAAYRERLVAELMERWQEGGESNDDIAFDNDPLTWLYRLITDHNRQIFENGQQSLVDPFSYNQSGFNLNYFGFEEEMIGFISIPRADIELPIYMGANRNNLRRGLAHLTYTSLPVGGTDTNAVIAGYINSGRSTMLGDIELLEIGDVISITNFYETIMYEIIDIRLIYPTQTDLLKIQSGRDLITLLAYRPGSAQRYMILAERAAE